MKHQLLSDGGESVRRIQPSRLAAYAFPRAASKERLALCTELIAWLFVFDDTFADGHLRREPVALTALHVEIMRAVRVPGEYPTRSAWALSLCELQKRFAAKAPADWLDRLLHSIAVYFSGCEIECSLRAAHKWPVLDDYLGFRDGSIGVYPMLDLVEFANEVYFEPLDACAAPLRQARKYCNLALAITNDIHSSLKERAEPDSFNAVAIIERDFRVDRATALRMTRELHDVMMSTGLRFLSNLPATNAVRNLRRGIEEWRTGNVRWSRECPRYNERCDEAVMAAYAAAG